MALERQLANLIGSVSRNVVPQRLTRLQANVFRIDRAREVVDALAARGVRIVRRACHINRVVGLPTRGRVQYGSPSPFKPYAGLVTPSDATGPRSDPLRASGSSKPADLPELRNTIVVAAFEGWNDAGDAASDALEHLDAIWEAEPIIEIDDEAYYDYQVNRPVIRQIDGVTRELVWPSMHISHCRPPGSDRDIVLMHGVEPNMRWRTFCAELLAITDKLNVDTVVILGALLADTPHTRPVPVSGAAYSPDSAKFFGLEETRYEGPTGIAGVFQDACVAAGIPAVTFWAAVPHYVSQPPNPKATVALLRRVEDVLDIEVPLADLPTQAEEWEEAVSEMTADDEEIAEYVASLEQRGDAEVDMTEVLGKIDGDALAAEFERYLRRRGPGFRS
jgi:proteasome assembly chaperone (PAC2) family protein